MVYSNQAAPTQLTVVNSDVSKGTPTQNGDEDEGNENENQEDDNDVDIDAI